MKRLSCIESLNQFHERCQTSQTPSSAVDSPDLQLPQMCDNCHYRHVADSSEIKDSPPLLGLSVVDAPGLRAELLMIFQTLMRTVRDVVKADAEKCTAQHAGMETPLAM